MDGNKWNAFVLDLSFIGWNVLSYLTLGLVGLFDASPYENSTNAALYRVASVTGTTRHLLCPRK